MGSQTPGRNIPRDALIEHSHEGSRGSPPAKPDETILYDTPNRFSSAQSQAPSGPNCWGQGFNYDRYGNLTGIASTKCGSPAMTASVDNKNRITNSGFTYDDAGNLTTDGAWT